jgi:hypothetical protein
MPLKKQIRREEEVERRNNNNSTKPKPVTGGFVLEGAPVGAG